MSEGPFQQSQTEEMRAAVRQVVQDTPVTDIHTHLYSPPFGELLLWGVDELITYHYLIAETLRASDVAYDAYYAMSKREQADLIWQELFVERSPISEACRGVLTVLNKLGLDVAARDLDAYRAYFAEQSVEDYVDTVFKTAHIESVVMTNDPFDDLERPLWETGVEGDPRFHAALRIDPLLTDWPRACERLKGWGYAVEESLGVETRSEVRRFLDEWLTRIKALYMAVSLPPTFAFPDETSRTTLIAECVLPVAREHNVPFAMMIGVKRNVNPPAAFGRGRRRLRGRGGRGAPVRGLSGQQVHAYDARPREPACVLRGGAEIPQPVPVWMLVVSQRSEPDRGDHADALRAARPERRAAALGLPHPGSAYLQMDAFPGHHRRRTWRQVRRHGGHGLDAYEG